MLISADYRDIANDAEIAWCLFGDEGGSGRGGVGVLNLSWVSGG